MTVLIIGGVIILLLLLVMAFLTGCIVGEIPEWIVISDWIKINIMPKRVPNAKQAHEEYNRMIKTKQKELKQQIILKIKESNKENKKTASINFQEEEYGFATWAEEYLIELGYNVQIVSSNWHYNGYKLQINW